MSPPGPLDGDDGLILTREYEAVNRYRVVEVESLSPGVDPVLETGVVLGSVLVAANIRVHVSTGVTLTVEPSLIGPVILCHRPVGETVCGGVVVVHQQGEDSPAEGGECKQVLLVCGDFEQK